MGSGESDTTGNTWELGAPEGKEFLFTVAPLDRGGAERTGQW